MRRLITLTLAAAIGLAATAASCSSTPSNDLHLGTSPPVADVSTTSTAPTAPTAPTTTTTTAEPPTTSTAAPPPTSPPLDTMSAHPSSTVTSPPTDPTTTMTTADPPPTSSDLDPALTLTSDQATVAQDYAAARAARQACFFDPASCDYASFAFPESPMDSTSRTKFKTYVDSNLRAVAGHGSVQFRIEAVSLVGDSAFVTVCTYDTLVIFDVGDPSNPTDDVVLNDEKSSFSGRWELRRLKGRWLIYAGQTINQVSDGDLCGF